VVQGTVTVSGKPLDGVEVALVDIGSGAIHRTKSARGGSFKVTVPAGQYVIANRSTAGLAIGHAPAVVAVVGGKVASTQIDLVALAVPLPQPPQVPPSPAPAGTLTITPEPIACILVGEHPMIDARIEPSGSVARARLYFKSGASNEWYYGEATHLTPEAVREAATAAGAAVPENIPPGGIFRAWLPKPTIKASPITIYWLATTADLAETRSPDMTFRVVEQESDCTEGRIAPFGIPPEGLTFFSATTGAAVSGAVLGAGGLVLGAGAIALIVAAIAGGALLAVNPPGGGATPTPAATPPTGATPTPAPTPTDRPTPTPTPEPTPIPSGVGPPPCECATPGITCTIGGANPFNPSPSPCVPPG
jgi:hypothetical protein